MNTLSLSQIFGDGAFQNEHALVITKASLVKLIPVVNNTTESLLIAILLTALSNFKGDITDENNNVITDENKQPIEFDNSNSFEFLKLVVWNPSQIKRGNFYYLLNQIIIFNYVAD
ncbi:MAG: hypothetical protein V7K41_22290 [Nostoc sp.]|uniref:hypothetical protein n=1 Tax=Nostoc sp. TaxID=1180 RepID=UPI002FF6D276